MRNMLSTLCAAALLGAGVRVASAHEFDEERVRRARERQAAEREETERRIRDRRILGQRARQQRAAEIVEKVKAGIDPTNGRPLSRQQKRHIARKGYYA